MNIVCPIKLLLIQALRSGNIGPTIETVLSRAALRLYRTIVWDFPDRPVVPALKKTGPFVDWDTPAGAVQLTKTTKQMGLMAGLLADVTAHDWRRGFALDVANIKLPDGESLRVANEAVMSAMGHSRRSLALDIVDEYVGGIEADIHTSRALNKFETRKQPLFGAPLKNIKISNDDIENWTSKSNATIDSKQARDRAVAALTSEKKSEWIESEKSKTPLPTRRQATSQSKKISKSAAPSSLKKSELPSKDQSAGTLPTPPTDLMSVLDPRLFLDDPDAVNVNDSDVERLQGMLLDDHDQDSENIGSKREELALEALLDNVQQSLETSNIETDLLALPPGEFIDTFACINVVRNRSLELIGKDSQEALEAKWPSHVALRNSRDRPSRFVYKCTHGKCTYQTFRYAALGLHLDSCRGERKEVLPKPFECDRGSCDKKFHKKTQLTQHIKQVHDFTPRRCTTPNCGGVRGEIYETRLRWNSHVNLYHHPIEPTKCSFKPCSSEVVWEAYTAFVQHLRKTHKLMNVADMKPYLPTSPLENLPCPALPCNKSFKGAIPLTNYLTSKAHKIGAEEASQIVEQIMHKGLTYELVYPQGNNDAEMSTANGDDGEIM
jgi:hypothetical protein